MVRAPQIDPEEAHRTLRETPVGAELLKDGSLRADQRRGAEGRRMGGGRGRPWGTTKKMWRQGQNRRGKIITKILFIAQMISIPIFSTLSSSIILEGWSIKIREMEVMEKNGK